MHLKVFARAVLFFSVAFILTLGSAKAITVNATQSLLIDASFTSLNAPGANYNIHIGTTLADPFDGAPGGDYNVKLFDTSNVGTFLLTGTPAAGSTSDDILILNLTHPLNSILVEARPGVSFDVVLVHLTSSDANAILAPDNSFQAVAAPYNPVATPLPAALPLFATGLGALGLLGWRRKHTQAG